MHLSPVWLALTAAAAPALAASTAAPALLLALPADPAMSPEGWLVSEKYDGVRALWDGQQLRSRGGLLLAAPAWFLARLPPESLDGELWLGRGRFDELSGLVRRAEPNDRLWHEVRYLVFEQPGGSGPFAQRLTHLQALHRQAGPDAPWQVVAQERLPDSAALRRLLAERVAAGGEGLMLHRADAPYVTGRAEVLRKLKPVQDADAVVVGHEPGRGKYQGRLGALRVRDEQGREFRIGSGLSDAQRLNPPPLGSTVSYRARGLTATGLPRFATLWRVREPGW